MTDTDRADGIAAFMDRNILTQGPRHNFPAAPEDVTEAIQAYQRRWTAELLRQWHRNPVWPNTTTNVAATYGRFIYDEHRTIKTLRSTFVPRDTKGTPVTNCPE